MRKPPRLQPKGALRQMGGTMRMGARRYADGPEGRRSAAPASGALISMTAQPAAAPATLSPAARLQAVLPALDALLNEATEAVRRKVVVNGRVDSDALDREQRAGHGLAWLATYRMALRELSHWSERLATESRYGAIEEAILRVGAAEYLAQIIGGIPMNQGEIVRAADLGLSPERPA